MMSELVAVGRLSGRIRRIKAKLGRIYRELCVYGCSGEAESFFADNYHTVSSGCDLLLRYDKSARVSCGFELADEVINYGELSDTDGVILKAKSLDPSAEDVENLRYSICYRLILSVWEAVSAKSGNKIEPGNVQRAISMLAQLGSLDERSINDSINPVAKALSGDRWYVLSDSLTRRAYRLTVYRLAQKSSRRPEELAAELVKRAEAEDSELTSIMGLKQKSGGKKRLAVCLLIITAVISAAVAVGICACFNEAQLAWFLVLPSICAVKPLVDGVAMRLSRHERLLRLDPSSDEVKNQKCALVLSAVVSGPQSADDIYGRLYKLYAANPQENVKIVALCDFAPEQSPVTADDRATAESLDEMLSRLDGALGTSGKFACVLRKRSYSKTQDEYMGKERKRGAIMELCRYMAGGRSDYYAMLGCCEALRGTGYIVAADLDTEPHMDCVPELLAIAMHPANRPVIEDGRVVSGYGIVSPRMVTRLADSLSSGFAKGMGGIGSISGYDGDSLDFWQDVIKRGSFCGKGLINVEALVRCTSWLPEESILSHDILEGELVGTAYAGDVIFTEGFPKNAVSYFKRLDRWIRGDTQNLVFLFSKRFDFIAKLKLLDSLRRALTPLSVLAALYLGFFTYPEASGAVAAAAMALYLFPYISGLFGAVARQGAVSRRYFSGLINQTGICVIRLVYETVMLPTLAVKSTRAVLTGLWRLVTRKKLLEWTTSAAVDGKYHDPVMFFFISEIAGAGLLWSYSHVCRLFGLVFGLMPVLLIMGGRREKLRPGGLSERDKRELSAQTAKMWQFFADYVTEADSSLPPDNVQFSPVYRICHRTSPTNIGMYLLSALAACDRRLISVHNLFKRLDLTLGSVEKMEKYHGNLYNWYETKTLRLCPNPYVSSVDSANFVCSLVTLSEGLKEYVSRCPELEGIIKRVERLIKDTDLGIFYDGVRGLMAIGIDPKTGRLDPSRYDFLMSEARLGSFYAIASRQVPKSHWYRLSRTMLINGIYSGAASYSGTMFEYFMPELFIKSPEGSIQHESLRYALWCQKSYAASLKRPYGISESGYYGFDSELSYRYMAHGVPKTGLRRGLEADYVVSPYSTYISMGYSEESGMENLRRLKKYGMYSRYGFYEALDFTSPNAHGEPAAVKSYMSHHVGMSIIACLNILEDGIFQRRFARDINVVGAQELLQERMRLDENVYENMLLKPRNRFDQEEKYETESYDSISVFEPRAKLLSNGEYSLVLTDSGISIAAYRGKNVYTRTRDHILRPKGAFFGISDGAQSVSFTLQPDMSSASCEFGNSYAAYYKNTDRLQTGMKVALHKTYPCELRSFVIKNVTSQDVQAELYSYIEPSMADDGAERAHPAFNRMFIKADLDSEHGIVTVTRNDSKEGTVGACMAIGFVQDILGSVSFDREEVLERPEGVTGLFKRAGEVQRSYISEPDPCVFIKTPLCIPPKSETEITMFILTADSMDELVNMASELRRRKGAQQMLSVSSDSAGGRLADALLPKILFKPEDSEERDMALAENHLELNALWEISVSTDIPLMLLKLNDRNDQEKLSAYLSAYSKLVLSGIKVQLAVLYDDGGRYERTHYTMLVKAAKDSGVEGMLFSSGGILPVDASRVRREIVDLLCAYACHISHDEIIEHREPSSRKTQPKVIKLSGVSPAAQRVDYPVALGGFTTDGSYVINERPPLPWCHVLSNRQFGMLVSDSSLGFSYAFNSSQLRLTPWDNDTSRDNMGERLILRIGQSYYDLINGAAAVFSPYKAEYFFRGDGFGGSVTASVSDKGMCSKISVRLDRCDNPDAELSFYCEPCLDDGRSRSHMIMPRVKDNTLLLSSCASALKGYMGVSCGSDCRFTTNRQGFLSGDWSENVKPCADPIAAAICSVKAGKTIDFYISYALDKKAALMMPSLYTPQRSTKEHSLRVFGCERDLTVMVNEWLRYQALHARMWARAGFYQCSGAYGFRDQLQDAVGILLENPSECRSQILRACRAQFEEGDVLHWWHMLPGKKSKGIRTKISDDNLWLVYAVCEYVKKTGDRSILWLKVSYCAGISLKEGQHECYGEVYSTSLRETVYEHCRKAIDYRAGQTGPNGLMLIGTGDWNDGFSRLGAMGNGESVWLTEFYILCLRRFAQLCREYDSEYSSLLEKYADELELSIVKNGKDDGWYRRAYADDGTVLGSVRSKACQIDSIAQSFAQFAELKDAEFTKNALLAAYDRLADLKRGVIKLFTPAFDRDFKPNVGYISHYPQGLRENGGQYTHAAIWLGMAALRAGLSDEGKNMLHAINPITHSRDGGYKRYKVEPYYVCADVYASKSCYSRGGWSIYTGSAAWYYRALTEDILGIRQEEGRLSLKNPIVPAKISYDNTLL